MELKTGDIIPIDMPEDLTVFIEDLPSYKAKLGRNRDNVAVKITKKLKVSNLTKSDMDHVVLRGGLINLDDKNDENKV